MRIKVAWLLLDVRWELPVYRCRNGNTGIHININTGIETSTCSRWGTGFLVVIPKQIYREQNFGISTRVHGEIYLVRETGIQIFKSKWSRANIWDTNSGIQTSGFRRWTTYFNIQMLECWVQVLKWSFWDTYLSLNLLRFPFTKEQRDMSAISCINI